MFEDEHEYESKLKTLREERVDYLNFDSFLTKVELIATGLDQSSKDNVFNLKEATAELNSKIKILESQRESCVDNPWYEIVHKLHESRAKILEQNILPYKSWIIEFLNLAVEKSQSIIDNSKRIGEEKIRAETEIQTVKEMKNYFFETTEGLKKLYEKREDDLNEQRIRERLADIEVMNNAFEGLASAYTQIITSAKIDVPEVNFDKPFKDELIQSLREDLKAHFALPEPAPEPELIIEEEVIEKVEEEPEEEEVEEEDPIDWVAITLLDSFSEEQQQSLKTLVLNYVRSDKDIEGIIDMADNWSNSLDIKKMYLNRVLEGVIEQLK